MDYLPLIVLAVVFVSSAGLAILTYRSEAARKRRSQQALDRLIEAHYIMQEDGQPLMKRGTEVD